MEREGSDRDENEPRRVGVELDVGSESGQTLYQQGAGLGILLSKR